MGKNPRLKQERLGAKLLQIRNALGLSQTEMWKRLGIEDLMPQKQISKYEIGNTEPPLVVMLQYARIAGIHLEDLVDDEADLPAKLPGKVKHVRLKPTAAVFRSKRRSLIK
jgi:transcriptional regulator with XRE-family HTH domain